MNKEKYYDALTYLYEHSDNCVKCDRANAGCNECERNSAYELEVAHYRLSNLIEIVYQLEKALDKACKELSRYKISVMQFNEDDFSCSYEVLNEQEWKEWCLKEVKEDE